MAESSRILVGVSGGIAAYKVCDVVSDLAKQGLAVRCLLTDAAQAFIPSLTLATLSRHRAYTDADFWSAQQGRPLHIDLGEWAEVLLLAPLTANTLAKLAHGYADNLLTNTLLASTCPVLLAPAMNTDMWQQPPVQDNWQRLLGQPRYHAVGPEAGVLACDRVGTGRMAAPGVILNHLRSLLYTGGQRDLAGERVLISAGSTREFLDPVRFIGNPATGRMGVALALAAAHRGAQVTVVHGPLEAAVGDRLAGLHRVGVTTAAEMHSALLTHLPQADWILMAAAVADVQPASRSEAKLAKGDLPAALPLAPVVDILSDLSRRRASHQRLIGFAAQTGEIVPPALDKLRRKRLDAIVANPVDRPGSGFGSETNQAIVLDAWGGKREISPCSKLELAHQIWDICRQLPHTATV